MGELKYLIFFIALVFGVPAGVILGGIFKPIERVIFFLSMFFTCRMTETINFLSRETYRGTSRGFEIHLVDLAVLCLFFFVFRKKGFREIKWFPPGSILYFIYFTFSLISISNSGEALYSWFEILKMVRMYFVLWTFTNYISSEEDFKFFLFNVGGVILYLFFSVIFGKYLGGQYQARGPFPHQNSLVMYMQVFGGIAFSLFYNSAKNSFRWSILAGISGLIVLLTLSRGGMACFAVGISVIIFLSLVNKFELKKILLIGYMFFGASLVMLKSLDSIITRFETAPKESAESRVYLAKIAINMANDKFFGVGLNNFGLKVNKPYPYAKDSPRYHEEGFREGLVETSYLMIAAETGWLNLGVFLTFLFTFYFRVLLLLKKYWREQYAAILIGILGGLSGIYLESTLEWVLKQSTNFYQLMMIFGVIGALRINNFVSEKSEESQLRGSHEDCSFGKKVCA